MNEKKINSKMLSWCLLFTVISLTIFSRFSLLDFPLERDEGEYAYFGQLISQGIPPYGMAYNIKFPGIYFMYFVLMSLFGQTVIGIHFGLLIVNIMTIIAIFMVNRKITDNYSAVIASATYAVLALGSSVFGFAAHATHFVVLPAIWGFLVLLNAFEKDKLSLYYIYMQGFYSGWLLL